MNPINSGARPPIPLGLTGINEQGRFNPDSKDTTQVLGYLQRDETSLELPNGITRLSATDGSKVLSIHQSFNSSGLIYIQTENNIYAATEDEFFGRTPVSVLAKNTLIVLENMSLAILSFSLASGTNGGTYTTGATWQTCPINTIESQFNTAGVAATFCTNPAAGTIRLTTGRYRINGWVKFSPASEGVAWQLRLRNISTSLNTFAGKGQEIIAGTSSFGTGTSNTHSGVAHFGGEFTVAAGTEDLSIQYQTAAVNNNLIGGTGVALGRAHGIAGLKECYALVSIWKVI